MDTLSCPACQMKQFETTYHDFLMCMHCGLGFLTPSKRSNRLRSIQEVYLTKGGRAPESPEEADHKGRVARRILEIARKDFTLPEGPAYEIGSGSGYMVNAMRAAGMLTHGNDVYLPPDQPVSCWDRFPFDQEPPASPLETFSLIYAWDSLEHVYDLPVALGKVTNMLKPGGLFVMHSPNFEKYRNNKNHPYWEPGHLWHMTPDSMEKFLGEYFDLIIDWGHLRGDAGLAAADNFVLWGVKL